MMVLTAVAPAARAQDDHGNTAQTATKVKPGKTYNGVLEVKGDVDFFTFKAKKYFAYSMIITDNQEIELDLIDNKGALITSDRGEGKNRNTTLVYMPTSKEVLYVKVQGQTNATTGAYNLAIAGEKITKALPFARADHTMAYTDDMHETLLFGGAYGGNHFNDAWLWDGNKWTYLKTKGGKDGIPARRSRQAMVYDAANGVFLMFGGKNPDGLFGDTWALDGNTWRLVSAAGPRAREGHDMVYDPDRGVTILFGGKNGDTYYNDVWEWDGGSWSRVFSAAPADGTAPAARAEHGMVWDGARSCAIIYGGGSDGLRAMSDTWKWDGAAWEQITPYYTPSGRRAPSMAYNVVEDRSYLFGGFDGYNKSYDETSYLYYYIWNNEYWWSWSYTREGPTARAGQYMVYDAYRQEIVMFGGWDDGKLYNDTWVWANDAWHEMK